MLGCFPRGAGLRRAAGRKQTFQLDGACGTCQFQVGIVRFVATECRVEASNAVGDKPTILIVDDEESDRELISAALIAGGYPIVVADGYHDAMAAFHEDPDISFLVTDVALPDGNGCALAMAIHQRRPILGVLFVSGHVGGEACHYYGLDVTDLHFLRKPFDGEDLVARVKRVMKSEEPFPSLYVGTNWR